jgi:hypothetical protein
MFTDKQIKLFWSHVDVGPIDRCWNWKLSTDRDGYGKAKIGGRFYIAHRVAYEIRHGSIVAGLPVLHSCDNPICCNPAHHRQGTHTENMKDMYARNRWNKVLPFHRKLDYEAAEQIRRDFKDGMSKRAIAKKHGIAPRHVRDVISGECWRTNHLPTR